MAGDSVGDMPAALTILAKQRGDVTFIHQSMYYPVTDAAQDSNSYVEFADGPFLTTKAMAWFWDAYCPDEARRSEITASPLRASLDELSGLPEAFLIVDENDVLRAEGEAYARRLTEAGVRTTSVRFNGPSVWVDSTSKPTTTGCCGKSAIPTDSGRLDGRRRTRKTRSAGIWDVGAGQLAPTTR